MAKNLYEKFDKNVNQLVVFAQAASIEAKVDCIYPESFVIGLLNTGANDVSAVLVSMNINLERCLKEFRTALNNKRPFNETKDINYNDLKLSKTIIDICKEAERLISMEKLEKIGLQHIFIAMCSICVEIRKVFDKDGFKIEEFNERYRKNTKQDRPDKILSTDDGRKITSALEAFCTNFTEKASQNKFDPIIAREKEIEEAITILCRRIKNNPILVGEAGVGKTSIVEGIAQRIVSGTVPKHLLNCKVYSLSLSSLVAGTKYRGEFEERMELLIKEVQGSTDCILFIDEIHTMIGAGSGSGSLDASNILKPFLARGELRCIGATTCEDYKKHFSKESALMRRFQQVLIEEPNKDQMHQILAGIKTRFEEYHNCIISDEAIDYAIDLSERYITDRFFPDKAIDCIDTTCAKFIWNKQNKKEKPVITGLDVAKSVSELCQIPMEIMLWDNYEKINKIESVLSKKIIGQDHVIKKICRVLKNSYSGVRNPNRPIGVFVFGGQSGTGKTYTAKELSMALFDKESSLIRLDMTEYSEPHSVSKLIGSPPGYVGFRDTDIFIDKIKRKPYSIVLLDEAEKAHPDVMKMFLQVMSDGIMTDAVGETVNFKNVILILTGNFGMNEAKKNSLGFAEEVKTSEILSEQKRLITYCQEQYGVEFINRVDEFVPFMVLNDTDLRKIIDIKFDEIRERIKNRKCEFVFDGSVYDYLINLSKEEHGKNATLLNRLVSKEIEPCLSDSLLSLGNKSYVITISVKNGELIYEKKNIEK